MDKAEWKKKITAACKKAGTYQDQFKYVIDTLAQIMENRDNVHEQYVEDGSRPTITHTNKAKETNIVKNPMLVMELDLNAQALAYWRDLGLTPAGLRKLNADVVKDQKAAGGLEKLLAGLGDS
jgi:P27 family predicted phage terminase small subunit